MKTKKSKFATIIFSFLPGAGHMFMGVYEDGNIIYVSILFYNISINMA